MTEEDGMQAYKEAQNRITAMMQELERLRALERGLRMLEWCNRDGRCPVCFAAGPDYTIDERGEGHAPDCELAKLLGGGQDG